MDYRVLLVTAMMTSGLMMILIDVEAQIEGWPPSQDRNVSIYVKPNQNTTLNEPKIFHNNTKLFLLIIVISASENFDRRSAIRDTWGSHENYKKLNKINNNVQKSNLTEQLKIKDYVKRRLNFTLKSDNENGPVDFKLAFLIGLNGNQTVNADVESEINKYGDIIVENFTDTYNNVTLKSVFMLKWVTSRCEGVRYILRTDDDVYINMPKLISNLRLRARRFDRRLAAGYKGKEYLLMGRVCRSVHVIRIPEMQWYTPYYLYDKDFYPHYICGTGYVVSMATAGALYKAALKTPYFHIEDVYITGLCVENASPHLSHTNDPSFNYYELYDPLSDSLEECAPLTLTSSHYIQPPLMRAIHEKMTTESFVRRCSQRLEMPV